jgi:hypothetical protein
LNRTFKNNDCWKESQTIQEEGPEEEIVSYPLPFMLLLNRRDTKEASLRDFFLLLVSIEYKQSF